MKSLKKLFRTIFFVGITAIAFTSCVDDDFDNPPANGSDPDLTANATIADVKALFVAGTVKTIDSNYIFQAIVIADDKSGNFYKSIVLQDSTGAINIQIDQSNYNSSYKIGRKVFVKCKGLVIGDYNGLIQLGGYDDNSGGSSSVGRIPQSLVPQHLVGGVWNQPYDTLVLSSMSPLQLVNDQNKLIRLDNVHFDTPCQTWADMVGQTSGNRNLVDAFGNTIVVRTSNFATFASDLVPGATGSVIGVFQTFGSTLQLVLRSLDDVLMAPPNCTVWGATNKIRDLRSMFAQGTTTIPAGSVVKGIVISDNSSGNINYKNLVLQDSTGGIVIRFTGANMFALGDEVQVDIGGQALYDYQGLLEIDAVANSLATKTGTGIITPRVETITNIMANAEAWESTLVKIMNVNISGGAGTYSGSVNVTDATGIMTLYTNPACSFAGVSYPTTTVNVTGIISEFSTGKQLNLRNTTDVQ